MSDKYIISIDQSTQGTKALLFGENGILLSRTSLPHKQMISEKGWISHDAEEIYRNTVEVVKTLIEKNSINKEDVLALGISNQRETALIWDKNTHKPLAKAVVWQCDRAATFCEKQEIRTGARLIREKTGIELSPYFPAAKIGWMLEHVEGAQAKSKSLDICYGTIDSWLVYKLTSGISYKTDFSNASRTQLFNIFELRWDEEICHLFGIDVRNLPEVVDSDSCFGETTLDGYFERAIPIHSVLGDSHAALFGQGCLNKGMIKATYGTGSSIMMHIGDLPLLSDHGLVTSLAWGRSGKVEYVLEGNLNYAGAVISWLKDDMKLISLPNEAEFLAEASSKNDELYVVPAFSGLGAPYWNSKARAVVVGMDRTTGRAEFVRAGLECIAYQISDIIGAMEQDTKIKIDSLRVDGGPAENKYLMQFQSDILNAVIQIPEVKELSGIGAAYMAGISLGIWNNDIWSNIKRDIYHPKMEPALRDRKMIGWKKAVGQALTNGM